MMKGALFDLDGVLADTASLHFKAWRKLAKENFGRSLPDELENKTRGILFQSFSTTLKSLFRKRNSIVLQKKRIKFTVVF